MLYSYLPAVGFIATILVLVPLPRQIRVRNVATISASFWLFGASLKHSLDPIIWAENVHNSAPVWCDISIKFRQAAIVGLYAATFCICKHLELISSGRVISRNHQIRRKIFESVMCFGLPSLWVLVCYTFQIARFVIVENFGCDAVFFRPGVGVIAMASLPVLLLVGTLLYGFVALYHLMKHHRTSSKLLGAHLFARDSALSFAQYGRLMTMSIVLGLWGLSWMSLGLKYLLGEHSWHPIRSTHSTVIKLPAILLSEKIVKSFLALWWGMPGSAYLFFLLFATSQEVWSEYQKLGAWLWTSVLGRLLSKQSAVLPLKRIPSVPSDILPIHVETTVSKDLESFEFLPLK